MSDETAGSQESKALFANLVMMLSTSAMQQLGMIENPITKQAEVNLQGAQLSIDMLSMLRDKTTGNRDMFLYGYRYTLGNTDGFKETFCCFVCQVRVILRDAGMAATHLGLLLTEPKRHLVKKTDGAHEGEQFMIPILTLARHFQKQIDFSRGEKLHKNR